MALADRIRTILAEMDGPEYGKQARLAKIARCGRPVVNHWLSGNQEKINAAHAMGIANALDYRVEWVLEGKGPKRKNERDTGPDYSEAGEPLIMIHVTQQEMEILMAYRAADPIGRNTIEHICTLTRRGNMPARKS